MREYLIGIDVGGTKTEAVLLKLDSSGNISYAGTNLKIASRQRIPTEREKPYAIFLENVTNLINTLLNTSGISKTNLLGIGLGIPGVVNNNIMLLGSTPMLINKNITSDLEKLFSTKVLAVNDANAFAFAEVFSGAGVDFAKESGIQTFEQIGIGIILGTGLGGGIIYKGNLLTGRTGFAAEFGHIQVLEYPERECFCGKKHCAENNLSGSYFLNFHNRDAATIFGDLTCSSIVNDYLLKLSHYLYNLTLLVDPDYFVIGGGLSNLDQIYTIRKNLQDLSFIPEKSAKVLKNKLGDSAGVIGAALIVLKETSL